MIRALIFDLFDVLFSTELSPECHACETLRFEPYFGSLLKHIVPINLAFFLGLYCRDKTKSEAICWQ